MAKMRCGDPDNPGGPGHRSDGRPCRMPVVPGTFRCVQHGGASPAAKWKAEQAMALLRVPAIEATYRQLEVMENLVEKLTSETCETCGFPDVEGKEIESLIKASRAAARVAQSILDRTGLGPRHTLEIKQSDGDLDLQQLTAGERAELTDLLVKVRELKERVRRRVFGDAFLDAPSQVIDVPAQPARALGDGSPAAD